MKHRHFPDQTHVDVRDTYDYIELCNFIKLLLFVSICHFPVFVSVPRRLLG
jgi:hypothetical protein